MKVVLYSAPACTYCLLVKNFLKKNNIQFEEIDISKNREKAEEIAKKTGHLKVPITEISGKFIFGFDTKKMKEALGI